MGGRVVPDLHSEIHGFKPEELWWTRVNEHGLDKLDDTTTAFSNAKIYTGGKQSALRY